MEFKVFLYFGICFVCGVRAAKAKIVYLNGTEIFNDNFKNITVTTTIAPAPKWYSVFNPRNISNHSGMKNNPSSVSTNRKNDEAEQEVEIMEEENGDEYQNVSLATRSGRQLSLFNLQRILNGMHLLALLGGIYLMIFVVEPVAVPQPYLSQHYYGLPWSAERRNNPHKEHAPPYPLLKDNSHRQDSAVNLQNKALWIDKVPQKNNVLRSDAQRTLPQVDFNFSQTISFHHYLSKTTSPPKQASGWRLTPPKKQGSTRYSINSAKPYHWSGWNILTSGNKTESNKNSGRINENSSAAPLKYATVNERDNEKKLFNSTGSATSINLRDILH